MARMASHFSGGKSCSGATYWMPALLTRMSSRLDDCRIVSIISRMASGFDIIRRRIGDVYFEIRCDLGLQLRDVVRLAEPVERDVGAGGGQRPGDAQPD